MTARSPRWSKGSAGEPGSPWSSGDAPSMPAKEPGPIVLARSADHAGGRRARCRSGRRSIGSVGPVGSVGSIPRNPYGPDEPFDRLILVPGEASPPKSDTGPFRVELLRICRERDLDLAPGLSPFGRFPIDRGPQFRIAGPGSGPEVKEVRTSSFFAELLISTEPRLRIVGEASLERLKATDAPGALGTPGADGRGTQGPGRAVPDESPPRSGTCIPGCASARGPGAPRRPSFDGSPWPIRPRRVAAWPNSRASSPSRSWAGGPIPSSCPWPTPGQDDRERRGPLDDPRGRGEAQPILMARSNSRSRPKRPAETLRVQGPGIGPLEINRPTGSHRARDRDPGRPGPVDRVELPPAAGHRD